MVRLKMAISVALLAPLLLASGGAQAAEFSAADVYRTASPSVVLIFAYESREAGRSGTGSVISPQGLVITNSHVISDADTGSPYKWIFVYLKPEPMTGDSQQDLKRGLRARVVAQDRDLDLALLKIEGAAADLPVLPFGDSERVEIGESVAAIGHPGGGGLWTLTTGTISSARREGARDVFQTDAALNPGNSGGPLIDAHAHLIGINTFIRRRNKQGLPLEGLNYSLRSGLVRKWLESQGIRVAVEGNGAAPAAASPRTAETRPDPVQPAQAAPAPVPRPQADRAPEPSPNGGPKDEPREFHGPNGERMFGVPNPSLDLEAVRRAAYERARENARKAFDELGGPDLEGF